MLITEIKDFRLSHKPKLSFKKKPTVKKAFPKQVTTDIGKASVALVSTAIAGITLNNNKKIKEELIEELKDENIPLSDIKWNLVFCKEPDGNYNPKAIELFKSYARNHLKLSEVASLEYILKKCRFGDETFSNSVLDKLIESSNEPDIFAKRIATLGQLYIDEWYLPKDYMENILQNPDAYLDYFNNQHLVKKMFKNMVKAISYKDESFVELLMHLSQDKNMPLDMMDELVEWFLHREKNRENMSSLIKDISNQNEFLWRKTFNSQSKEKLKRIPTQENIKTFRQLKEQALKHPNLYVQADLANLKNIDFLQSRINKFFYVNGLDIAQILSILDFQTMEHIMRQRPVNVTKLIQIFNSISDKNLDLVKKIISCKNSDGSELTIKQKAESFNIVDAYIKNGISTDKIEKIVKSEDFNFIDLFKPLFEKLLKNSNMTRREIKNFDYTKIEGFDISKVHLILKTMQTDSSGNTADLVKVMFNTDFKQYIHDSENIYGRKNLQTKEFFKENNLDYSTWINIDKDLEVRFQSEPQEFDLLKSISTALVESIEILRKNRLEKFIDKRFADCIKNGKFCLAPEIIKNKDRFVNFVKNLMVELNPIYERAKKNFETDKKNYKAINTLTVFYHIKECLKQLENIKISDDSTKMKEVDYTIKMWDRNPLKDILQGNHSDCCIQAGGVNGRAISQYLLYTTFNMLEIFDNKSDKIIGNILCYFVKNENNEPVLVLDNIEITPNHQLSGKADKEFRNAILEYAKKVAYAVSHNEDTKIYLGSNYNDVGCGDLEEFSQNVNIIGSLAQDDEYYFDAMNGWVDVYRKDTCKLNYHDLSLN